MKNQVRRLRTQQAMSQEEFAEERCDLIVATGTKTRKNREVPMNSQVREILLRLCRGKRPDDYVFVSKRTGRR